MDVPVLIKIQPSRIINLNMIEDIKFTQQESLVHNKYGIFRESESPAATDNDHKFVGAVLELFGQSTSDKTNLVATIYAEQAEMIWSVITALSLHPGG